MLTRSLGTWAMRHLELRESQRDGRRRYARAELQLRKAEALDKELRKRTRAGARSPAEEKALEASGFEVAEAKREVKRCEDCLDAIGQDFAALLLLVEAEEAVGQCS